MNAVPASLPEVSQGSAGVTHGTALWKAKRAVETRVSIIVRPLPGHVALQHIFFSAAEENEAESFLREAANTLNTRKSFHGGASSKLNRGELFGRGPHFLHATPSLLQGIQTALISLYKWKLNHCIPGWKGIGNESMSEVKT